MVYHILDTRYKLVLVVVFLSMSTDGRIGENTDGQTDEYSVS